jgi:hypothetical protein
MQTKSTYKKPSCFFLILILTCVTGSVTAKSLPVKGSEKSSTDVTASKEDPAITRTRQQVKMLDDLYKTAVVLITTHYVTDPSKLSAATAAKALFAAMKKNGWHEVRLLGLTDTLINPKDNLPKDAFERKAKEALLAGKASHEAVVTKNGTRYLRVATSLPVVMDECIMCHANFQGMKGAIGSLSYTVPVVE